jgi:hypothetical protein
MTLRQTIQAAPAKTAELIDKLANTSNQAVKTRETVCSELAGELTRYVELEEQHLFPAVRKHPQAKDFAGRALKVGKELRALVAELEAMPKDSDAFTAKVITLKKAFETHIRGERSELLPAMLKALNDEEAAALAEKLEVAVADAEAAKREAKREDAAEARREAEAAEQVEADKRAAVRAKKAAERATHDAVESAAKAVKQGAAAAENGVRRAGASVARQAAGAATAVGEAVATCRSTSRDVANDLVAVSASTTSALKVVAQVGSAWLGLGRKVVALNLETSRRIIKCRSIGQLATVQRDYVNGSMRSLMEGRTEVLEIAQKASKTALNPLQVRLDAVA